MNGWISLHRQIRDNWIWNDSEKLKAWIDILLEVNHSDKQIPFDGHIKIIKRGQKLTSIRKLSERWGWSRNRVATFLDLLIEAEMVTADRTRHGTLLTVVNYDKFQPQQDTNGATNRATHRATEGPPTEPRIEHKQKRNNKNNVNNENNFFCADALKKIPPEKSDVEEYCRRKRYHGVDIDGFFEYYDMRGWKLSGGLKMPDWTKAVDYWHSKGKRDAEQGQEDMPYFREFETAPAVGGGPSPFEGGAAAEMLRRLKAKNERSGQ